MKTILITFTLLLCGANAASIDSRIINGHDSQHVPSLVYIGSGGPDTGTFGAGHIISDLHILTSASLIAGFQTWHLGIGFNRISIQINYTSFAGVPHADFNVLSGINDIGIIFMPFRLDFTSPNIQPIAIPSADTRLPMENEQGIISGYGSISPDFVVIPEILQTTYQRVSEEDLCLEHYPGTDMQNSFCAFDDAISNACFGDTGGGFITLVRGVSTLTGVVTTRNLCQLLIPKSYTRVAAYREWIRSITQV